MTVIFSKNLFRLAEGRWMASTIISCFHAFPIFSFATLRQKWMEISRGVHRHGIMLTENFSGRFLMGLFFFFTSSACSEGISLSIEGG
jgi:hypothetical protein